MKSHHNLHLKEVPSTSIDTYMSIPSPTSLPPQFSDLHGLFYMKGNPMPDEICSFSGTYDPDDDTLDIPLYAPGVWSFDATFLGRLLYAFISAFRFRFSLIRVEDGWKAIPVLHFPPYLHKGELDWGTPGGVCLGVIGDERALVVGVELVYPENGGMELPSFVASFKIVPDVHDPDAFVRQSWILGVRLMDYEFLRIVRGDGSRTEKFVTAYVDMMGKGYAKTGKDVPVWYSWFTHLEDTQMVVVEGKKSR
ncbi:hypothetical protein BC829DRAFT_395156 [Chytridium lagenaria]|nr:hypothetical protein BC829DRAFT_395156 [Chytridium lagenaria]